MNISRLLFTLLCLVLSAATLAAPKADSARRPAITSKLSSPLSISSDYAGLAVVGQPQVLQLTVTASDTAAAVELTLAADPALAIIEPQGVVAFGTLAAGEPVTVEVTVVPLAGGTSHLRISATADIRGRRQSSGISVPFHLPEASPAQAGDDEAGKSEASVRSLQAVEEIL
jgi:hypothetical protein